MRNGEKKTAVIVAICGIILVVWVALLTAPYMKSGLIGILQGWNRAFKNPFSIMICEYGLRTVLFALLSLWDRDLPINTKKLPKRGRAWIGGMGRRERHQKTVQRQKF